MKPFSGLRASAIVLAASAALAAEPAPWDEAKVMQTARRAVAQARASAPAPAAPGGTERSIFPEITEQGLPQTGISDIVRAIPAAQARFRRQYAVMPECTEKWYMEASFITRAWIDAGGAVPALPSLDPFTGYQNAEILTILRYWLFHDSPNHMGKARNPFGVERRFESIISQNEGALAEVQDSARRRELEKERARLMKAEEAYIDFQMRERLWLMGNPGVRAVR